MAIIGVLTGGKENVSAASVFAQTYVLVCEGFPSSIVFHPNGKVASLTLEGRTTELSLSDKRTFSGGGQQVILQKDHALFNGKSCHYDNAATGWEDARKNGANFRAIGYEPAWSVELYPKRMVLSRGDDTLEQPVVRYGLSYLSEDYTVTLAIGSCRDDVSGEEFATKVTVQSEKETLHGCGRRLD